VPPASPQRGAVSALHIGVIREGRFVDDRYFEPPFTVSAGTAEKNTFVLTLSSLPASVPLFADKGGKTVLLFDEGTRGKVSVRGRELDLAEARRSGLAVQSHGAWELPLDPGSKGRVQVAEVTFVFNFAPPPPKPKPAVLPPEARGSLWNVTDHRFMGILALSLLVHVGCIAAVSRQQLPPEDTAMEEIPDRFAKLLVPEKPPPEEEKPKPEEKKEEEAPKDEAPKEEAKKEAPKDSAEHKAEVQKVVQQKGLVKILGAVGAGGGGALANVLAQGGGFSDDIGSALAGAGGVAIATEAGTARKGEGAAQAAGIGALATSGSGGGARLREKQDVAVRGSVSAEGDAEVDSPTVDKEALGRFIKLRLRSIQGCYEAQLKRNPNLRGKIVLRFTIGTRGQVVEVSIDSDTMGNDEVASCVMRLVKAWRLPFTPDGDTPVSFPFLFQPG
jgi:outer membrane biosynthesis protein TonB